MRKQPTRPNSDISQQYNSGLLTIYQLEDVAPPGYAPKMQPREKVKLRYEEQPLGINRLYLSRQNQIEISRVVRTMWRKEVSTQDVAVTEDGRQYRIDTVQVVQNVWPASMDLSLVKIEQVYDYDME